MGPDVSHVLQMHDGKRRHPLMLQWRWRDRSAFWPYRLDEQVHRNERAVVMDPGGWVGEGEGRGAGLRWAGRRGGEAWYLCPCVGDLGARQ